MPLSEYKRGPPKEGKPRVVGQTLKLKNSVTAVVLPLDSLRIKAEIDACRNATNNQCDYAPRKGRRSLKGDLSTWPNPQAQYAAEITVKNKRTVIVFEEEARPTRIAQVLHLDPAMAVWTTDCVICGSNVLFEMQKIRWALERISEGIPPQVAALIKPETLRQNWVLQAEVQSRGNGHTVTLQNGQTAELYRLDSPKVYRLLRTYQKDRLLDYHRPYSIRAIEVTIDGTKVAVVFRPHIGIRPLLRCIQTRLADTLNDTLKTYMIIVNGKAYLPTFGDGKRFAQAILKSKFSGHNPTRGGEKT